MKLTIESASAPRMEITLHLIDLQDPQRAADLLALLRRRVAAEEGVRIEESMSPDLAAELRVLSPEAIAFARQWRNLSQAELAREIGVAKNTVARWELGLRRPRGEIRERLIKYFRRTA